MIGIIVADKHEINSFPGVMKKIKVSNQFMFEQFNWNGHEIVMLKSGIGLVNAAAATQALICTFPELAQIWNFGAVGGDITMKIFDLVAPKQIFFHDVFTPWYTHGQTPGEKASYENALKLSGARVENLASGGSFIDSLDQLNVIKKNVDISILDMETAAIAQVADKNGIPLFVIKCVSDIIGLDSSKLGEINDRIAEAGKKAFEKMVELIK